MQVSKTRLLSDLISSKELTFLMEAHNGLSAKIVEEVGFKGIWASGLSISAALGVRDNNEASWTQILEVVEFMSDVTTIPILLDADTGYGNFNNVRRLVRKLEQRGIAGACIEDKLFPKTNSFINSEQQPLADINEFCGKIKAAKDTQNSEHFCLVARVEAFISGWGLSEAMKRAEAYWDSGADAILIHSKRPDATEIENFMSEWGNRGPVIIVPTKYYSTPTEIFSDLGISSIIWANHNCRAAITAMQKVSETIFRDRSLANVEGTVASVQEIFRLQGENELREAEKAYLPTTGRPTNAIILAASRGGQFDQLTEDIPKTLLSVGGKSILDRQVDEMRSLGINDISVVCGYREEKISLKNIRKVINDEFETTTDLCSLYSARELLDRDVVVSFGDVVFKRYVLHALLSDRSDITVVVDSDIRRSGYPLDYAKATRTQRQDFLTEAAKLISIETVESHDRIDLSEINGEFIGLWKVAKESINNVCGILDQWASEELLEKKTIVDLLNQLAISQSVTVRYIRGGWMDVDSIVDLQKANEL